MDISLFSLFVLIGSGAGLSFAVWMGGLMIRKRLRGPGRMIIMTVLLILWYMALYPLMTLPGLEPGTRKAYEIGVHSIWVWWTWALMRFLKRVKSQTARTNFKTGVYNATGIHRVTTEVRRLREKRKVENVGEGAVDSNFNPDI